MRKFLLPALSFAGALVLGLLSLLPSAPEADPSWWLLGGIRPAPARPADILILDAEPQRVLSPAELARELRDLAEFEAGSVLVDLPVDWAAGGTTSLDTLARLRGGIDQAFGRLDDNLSSFWQGLRSGSLRAADAGSGYEALRELLAAAKLSLLDEAAPNSAQLPSLEAALGLHPDSWFGLGLRPLAGPLGAGEGALLDRESLQGPEGDPSLAVWRLPEIAGIEPLPVEVAGLAAGWGFSLRDEAPSARAPVFPLRGFLPLADYEGRILPQPALLLLARRMEAERLEILPSGIRLVHARVFRGEPRDIFIPLDGQGRALLGRPDPDPSWPRRLPLSVLDEYRRAEARVVETEAELEKAGLLVASQPSLLWKRAANLGEALLQPRAPAPEEGSEVGGPAPEPSPAVAAATGVAATAAPPASPGPVGASSGTPSASSSQAASGKAALTKATPGATAPSSAETAVTAAPTGVSAASAGAGAAPAVSPAPLSPGAEAAAPAGQAPQGPAEGLVAWKEAKAAFFEAADQALSERERMDELLQGLLATPGMTSQAREGVEGLRDKADRAFGAAATALEEWKTSKARLQRELSGSLVLIGEAPYRSRGGFLPAKGAPPVDPAGEMAAFIRAGLSDAFISATGPGEHIPVVICLGLVLSLLLLWARPRIVLALGLLLSLGLLGFAALAFIEARSWWSPSLPILAALFPGLLGALHGRLEAWRRAGLSSPVS